MGLREQSIIQQSGISLLALSLITSLSLLAVSGHYTLGSAGILTETIATPVAGPADQGGDDGKIMVFSVLTAHAHIVQTAANKINTNKVTLTSSGTIGDFCMLIANGGFWWLVSNSGFTVA